MEKIFEKYEFAFLSQSEMNSLLTKLGFVSALGYFVSDNGGEFLSENGYILIFLGMFQMFILMHAVPAIFSATKRTYFAAKNTNEFTVLAASAFSIIFLFSIFISAICLLHIFSVYSVNKTYELLLLSITKFGYGLVIVILVFMIYLINAKWVEFKKTAGL